MTQGPVDAVLFDLGGVICESAFAYMARYAGELGLDPAALGHVGHTGRATELMARCETGEITMADYLEETARAVAAEHGSAITGAGLIECVRASLTLVPESVELVRETHAAHRTALVTNATTDIREHWRARLDLTLFDVVVDSSEVRLRKPEPGIYRHTLALLGCPAERAVFVDDQAANVDAARALGLRGVVFSDPAQARRELAALGVRVRAAA
jgi:glucose-1-phosphatase